MEKNLLIKLRDELGDWFSLGLAAVSLVVGVVNVVQPQFLQSRLLGLLLAALGVLITVFIWDRRIDRQKYGEINKSLVRLEPLVSVAQGALAADIVRLFPERNSEKAESTICEILSDHQVTHVSIAATALPSFFHLGRFHTEIVRESLERGVRFRVVLLNPRGEAADQRAARELGTTTVQDIERSIRSIQEYIDCSLPIEARLYDFPPQLYMLQTDTHVFVEPYHFGRALNSANGQPIGGCIGGLVPCYLAKKGAGRGSRNGVWDVMKDHFEYLWSGTYTDGQPLTVPVYSALKIEKCDFKRRGLTLTNCHRFITINLAGWSLRAVRNDKANKHPEQIPVYQFPDGQCVDPEESLVLKEQLQWDLIEEATALGTKEAAEGVPQKLHIELVNRIGVLAARFPNDGFVLDAR